jgi:hypothetical protein
MKATYFVTERFQMITTAFQLQRLIILTTKQCTIQKIYFKHKIILQLFANRTLISATRFIVTPDCDAIGSGINV